MPIGKKEFDASLRRMRVLYLNHARGELSPSRFTTEARRELNSLYMEYTRGLINTTSERVISELHSYQAQFGLDLECRVDLGQVTRGYRGIRAEVYIRTKVQQFASARIYIGPFDEWSKIAVHTKKELEDHWTPPSLYTKRRINRWKELTEFDFPELLQRIKVDAEKPRSDSEDDIPF